MGLPTSLDPYKGRCYGIIESSLSVPGEENQYIAYDAYPRHPFEEGSLTKMLTSIVVNVFVFKAPRAPRLFANPFPTYCLYSNFPRPASWYPVQVVREKLQ